MSEFEEYAWRRKRELISRAQSIAYNGDLRKGSDELQALSEEFKKAGRAGTDSEGIDQDDSLYREFKQAKDEFYERRRRAREQAISVKRSIVYEMGKLAGRAYDKSVGMEARALMDRWRAAERAPKAEEDQMWYELNKYRDMIKEASRRLQEEYQRKQDEYKRRQRDYISEKISNKESYISELESRLYSMQMDWQYREFREPSLRNPRYSEIMERERERRWRNNEKLDALRAKIERLQEEVRELKRKLDEL